MLREFSSLVSILYLILAAAKASKPLVSVWIPPEADPEARICLSGKSSLGRWCVETPGGEGSRENWAGVGRRLINEALSRKCLVWVTGVSIPWRTLGVHISRCLRMILLDKPQGWSIYLPVCCLSLVEIDLGSVYFPHLWLASQQSQSCSHGLKTYQVFRVASLWHIEVSLTQLSRLPTAWYIGQMTALIGMESRQHWSNGKLQCKARKPHSHGRNQK